MRAGGPDQEREQKEYGHGPAVQPRLHQGNLRGDWSGLVLGALERVRGTSGRNPAQPKLARSTSPLRRGKYIVK